MKHRMIEKGEKRVGGERSDENNVGFAVDGDINISI